MTHIKKHIFLYGLFLITIFGGLIAQNNLKKQDGFGSPFVFDTDQYYSILPSAFLHKDLTYSYDTTGYWNNFYPENKFNPSRYWTTEYLPGRKMTMATLGMPYAYTIFFFPAFVYEKLVPVNAEYPPGYSGT